MFIECDVDQQGHFEKALRKRIRRALEAENVKAEVDFQRIADDYVVEFADFHLPTVLLEWRELERGPEGPDVETIRAGIREILEGEEMIPRRHRETGRSWPWVPWACEE